MMHVTVKCLTRCLMHRKCSINVPDRIWRGEDYLCFGDNEFVAHPESSAKQVQIYSPICISVSQQSLAV